MKRFGTTTRIALAMSMWTATVLLALRMTGLLNDGAAQQIQSRTRLCEAVAVSCSQFASRNDWMAVEVALRSLKARNPEVLSAACRRMDGTLDFETGKHSDHWSQRTSDLSSSTCIQVPVLQGDKAWGQIEVCFQSPIAAGLLGFLALPSVKLIVLTSLACMLGFSILLRRCFNQLDPDQAIPERVRAALNTMAEGVVVLDEKFRINLANQPFADMLGCSVDVCQGKNIDSLPWETQDNRPLSQLLSEMHGDNPVDFENIKLQQSPSSKRTLKPNASRILNKQGDCKGMLLSLDDVSVLEEQNEQLRFLATRDPMTSCLNRRSFFEHLEQTWKSAFRYKHPVSCLMVDVDHFKGINDSFGHAVGDEVLKGVSAALLATARDTDFVCRYGGEEFCILLPHIDIDGVARAGERFRTAIEALQFPQLRVTASLGCSSGDLGAESADQLLEQADQALYFAKRNGRNQVARFDRLEATPHAIETQPPADAIQSEDVLLESIKLLIRDARDAGATSVSFDLLNATLEANAE
ncbi:putative diguanylate cyclase YdaM [Rosistilla carotiformis]|uniref:diguanylate cyclase n=1 Tax=Rosistilla carotiformis TaxID=2528017 RepID=A0A518JQF3_9BACT|nr:GGDEF domain-containing protein [Rosistilla carotiformis]QDV67771.1 putative diguanylate cyclase YdaM [Rosistilla carotiformis]